MEEDTRMSLLAPEPRVYLISRPSISFDQIYEFLRSRNLEWARSEGATESEELVEVGGRVCYMSFRNDPKTIRYPIDIYIRNLIDKGHESVLEHPNWTFLIDNVSRSFTHQLVRHRIGFSYSQLSQQYHDESNSQFVIPDEVKKSPDIEEIWTETVGNLRDQYTHLLEALQKSNNPKNPEDIRRIRSSARGLLPNSSATTILVSANARSLRHFFNVRGAIAGDIEMRRVVYEIFKKISVESPSLFYDFDAVADDGDGWPSVKKRDAATPAL